MKDCEKVMIVTDRSMVDLCFLNVFADVVSKAADDAGEAVSDERTDLVGFAALGNVAAGAGFAAVKVKLDIRFTQF